MFSGVSGPPKQRGILWSTWCPGQGPARRPVAGHGDCRLNAAMAELLRAELDEWASLKAGPKNNVPAVRADAQIIHAVRIALSAHACPDVGGCRLDMGAHRLDRAGVRVLLSIVCATSESKENS